MLLNELPYGAIVNLEIVKESKAYEVATTVVGASPEKDNSVLLAPFEYRGTTLDLGKQSFDKVVFRLYADDENGTRVGWPDVSVQVKEYQGRNYYVVTAPVYGSFSKVSERRSNARVGVRLEGNLTIKNTGETHTVEIYDISAGGISFTTEKDLSLVNNQCAIQFSEKLKGVDYNLTVECRCVRKSKRGEEYLYGCSVSEQSRSALTYVYVKKIMS